MAFEISCDKCGFDGGWLQVKADRSGRLGLREFRLQGISAEPGVWRSLSAGDRVRRKAGFYCARCQEPADSELTEGFEQTPCLQDEPVVFVDPGQVKLADEVASLKRTYGDGVVKVLESESARKAKTINVSQLSWLHPAVVESIGRKLGTCDGSAQLYQHQAQAIEVLVRKAGSVMLATTTSSGKSLCFQVPWLHDVAGSAPGEAPTALYLAPLNALIDDQIRSLRGYARESATKRKTTLAEDKGFLADIDLGDGYKAYAAQYHGGVPKGDVRREIRNAEPALVFTNPEMLSRALLTYALDVEAPGVDKKGAGGAWEYLFRRLRYVILDECHEFRGVYGSHVANLLRRIRRICALADNPDPEGVRFILCSATIRDPGKFAERLTGTKPSLVIDRKRDTSERYPKKLVILRRADPNRPLKDFAKGVLGKVFSNRRLRTIAFQESIPAVEELHERFANSLKEDGLPSSCFQVFTANYRYDERTEKLDGLRSGTVPGVVSTSALALGIDIGSLSCSALITYPGSIAKTWQMLGRAGRRGPGLQLFVVGDGFLDRYWEEHPEELLDQHKHLEELVIMPDNPYILAEHLVAAHFDHPLQPERDRAFFGAAFDAVLETLLDQGDALARPADGDEYFELVDGDRVFKIALRGTGAFKVPVYLGNVGNSPLLEEDQVRAIRRLYPGAVFIHDAKFYRVAKLRFEVGGRGEDAEQSFYAVVEDASGDRTTVPIVRTDIDCLEDVPGDVRSLRIVSACLGRLRVRTRVDQYYLVPYDPAQPLETDVAISFEQPSAEPATAPAIKKLDVKREPGKTPASHVYETDGMWLVVPDDALAGIADDEARYRALFTIGKAVIRAIPLLHYAGPDDLVFTPFNTHPAADGQNALFIYERTRGGVGLARRTYERLEELLNNALYIVINGCKRCSPDPTSPGCPSCVADISGLHDRRLAIEVLGQWLQGISRGGSRGTRRPPKAPLGHVTPQAALESAGFREIKQLGQGGMGRLFQARRDGQLWALKMAASDKASAKESAEIAREGLHQKQLADQWGGHPNILSVVDVISVAPYVFLRLEFADGGTLEERIGPAGYLPRNARGVEARIWGTVRDILPIIDAVAHLHDCGWVHRDIKPANILFVGTTPKLSDFGIAHRQAAGDEKTEGAGTPGFAAPGQIRTQATPDCRDDVYSLGVLLARMLTGRMPRRGGTGAVLPQFLPNQLRAIVKRAMSTQAHDRYANARELHGELKRLLDDQRKPGPKRSRR